MNTDNDILKRVQSKYSESALFSIYSSSNGTISLFGKRKWMVISFVSSLFLLTSLVLDYLIISIVLILVLLKSVSSLSKIRGYELGSKDGISSGFEYGQIYNNLEILQRNDFEKDSYLTLWYLIFSDGFEPNENSDKDMYLFKKLIDTHRS